jgi:tripartite motif-containing protein 71
MTEQPNTKKQRIKSPLVKLCGGAISGNGEGEFNSPTGVYASRDGILYVCDSRNNRIQCFDSIDGKFIRKWGGVRGNGNGEFTDAISLSGGISPQMCDDIMMEIKKVPELYAFPPGVLPICVAYVGDEHIYVCDTGNYRIQAFDSNGNFLSKWGKKGGGIGEFGFGLECAVSEMEGMVYVADSSNHRVQVFLDNGFFVREWDCRSESVESLRFPHTISVTNSGVWLSAWGGKHIALFHRDGTLDRSWVCQLPQLGELPSERMTAADNGFVYVTIGLFYFVQKYMEDGTLVHTWDTFQLLNQLGLPNDQIVLSDICVSRRDGRVYVVDTGHDCVYVIDTD